MALDVYFKDDVAQGIVAVAVAMLSAAVASGAINVEYCRGVVDVSRAQAMNYGLSWRALVGEIRAVLADEGIDVEGLIGMGRKFLSEGGLDDYIVGVHR